MNECPVMANATGMTTPAYPQTAIEGETLRAWRDFSGFQRSVRLEDNALAASGIIQKTGARDIQHNRESGMKIWQCVICNFIYDEAAGLPEEGIAPGTPWAAIPENWKCPECGVAKRDFEMVEI